MFSGGLAFLDKENNDFDNLLAGGDSNEKSNLADIFEADESENNPNEVNPTLKYIPPKSKPPQINTGNPAMFSVVIAKIVGAFKLVNDANTPLGQLGLALLKNSSEDTSKLILYKTKEHILSTLLLSKSSKVYWKPPYLQYHDDANGFWSLLFGSDADSNEFFANLEEACTIDRASTAKFEGNDSKEKEKEIERLEPTKTAELRNDRVDGTDTTAKTKSDVVYRVAKIGHQLPKIKPGADDDSDSIPSDTEKIHSMQPSKRIYNIPEKPTIIAPTQFPPKPTNISVALQPSFWPSSSFDLNTLAAENRIQHAEVRMNLSKLDSKLDRVLDNIECLRLKSLNPADVLDKDGEIIKLEEKVLELKKENRSLKLQLTENDKAKQDTNEKEKEELLILQKSNDEKELKVNELMGKLEELEENLNTEIEAREKQKIELTNKYMTEVGCLREELEKKKVELEEAKQQTQSNKPGEMIRGIMNQFYLKLYQSIEGKETMAPADLLKLTAEIIRKETKAALNSN